MSFDFWLGALLGALVGGIIGALGMAALAAGSAADAHIERMEQQRAQGGDDEA